MSIKDLVARLDHDPSIRAKIMYMPEKLQTEYGLNNIELDALKSGTFDKLGLTADEQSVLKRRLNYHGI